MTDREETAYRYKAFLTVFNIGEICGSLPLGPQGRGPEEAEQTPGWNAVGNILATSSARSHTSIVRTVSMCSSP